MARAPKLLTQALWPRLKELAKRPDRIWAAVPYFSSGGATRLPLKKGDTLVTRFDDSTIKAGMTDPKEILKLIKRGVAVHAHSKLHAKVYVIGDVAVVGSANVSWFSENQLVEAGLETRDASTVRDCRSWVNQNQTYTTEVRGNFMWSPKTNANGARNPFYDFMREVAPGDIVFSFCDTRIKALGVATGPAQTAPKPDFGNAGANWAQEGWFVPVYYCAVDSPIRPKDHIEILRALSMSMPTRLPAAS